MLYEIMVDLDCGHIWFVPESCQTTITHRATEIHLCKRKIAQHFNGIEWNFYYKHKNNADEKEFIELLLLCIQSSIIIGI